MKLDQMKQVLIKVVEIFFEEFIEIYIFKDLTGGFDLKMQFKFCLNFVQSSN